MATYLDGQLVMGDYVTTGQFVLFAAEAKVAMPGTRPMDDLTAGEISPGGQFLRCSLLKIVADEKPSIVHLDTWVIHGATKPCCPLC